MSDCIEWEGARHRKGYGRWPGGKHRFAHRRVMAEIHGDEAIAGKVVMHTCDNRLCVNPDHLRIGSHAENIADRDAKGRGVRGEQHFNSKLTASDVWIIRRWRQDGVTSGLEAAAYFGVTPAAISAIVKGHNWGWVK